MKLKNEEGILSIIRSEACRWVFSYRESIWFWYDFSLKEKPLKECFTRLFSVVSKMEAKVGEHFY